MAQPKKKLSSSRGNRRRSHLHINDAVLNPAICSNCNAVVASHTVCEVCGFYKGQLVLPNKAKTKASK